MKKMMIIGLLCSLAFMQCRQFPEGSAGAMTTEQRQGSHFTAIHIEDNIDVFVSQDTAVSIRVEAGENLIDYVETVFVGNEMVIYEAPNNIVNTKSIKVYVTTDSLYSITNEGSGNLDIDHMLSDVLNVLSNGSGHTNIEVNATHINVNPKGSGDVQMVGTCNTLNAYLQGSGDLRAKFLQANDVNVEVEGSGDAMVSASNSITATITGSGDITYYGNPSSVSTTNTGSGNINGN